MQAKPNKRPKYRLTVTATESLSNNYQRVTLQGDSIAHFGAESAGDYIKLLFTLEGKTDVDTLAEDAKPVIRTYTIRHFDTETNSIDVDLVRHTTSDLSCGFAARWATECKVGDTMYIMGPGKKQGINLEADWYFLAADMTALPALANTLNSLPEDAKGYAVIDIIDSTDKQDLTAPEGMNVIWNIQHPEHTLVDVVKSQPWLDGQCAVWCACEFDSMRSLRQYFRNEHEIERDYIYISSYWKDGVTEDGHKVIKRDDLNAQH
ncbi:siderophore-interacting protein [Vibrio sp. CAIM 722]|uniref:Siderophore-interacting protein n=1 Tax=Vibrio eleionomae TaxID=2653505 RepID=A0A7X4RW46_9VIBR|nr:siderophore-interacting protein [Vibrio eleionomae]MZI95243.1 siderophore-interacting protein [Vibrio eleionomae]